MTSLQSKLAKLLAKYRELGEQIKKLEDKRKRMSLVLKSMLDARGAREMDAGGFRALRYPIVKVDWSVNMLAALSKERDVDLTKVVADEDAIERAVAEGKVTMEEVHACGKVRKAWGLRVDPLE